MEEQKRDSHKRSKRRRRDSDSVNDSVGGQAASASHSQQDTLSELFDGLYEFLRQSLSLYMQHIYASHVIRAVLQVLSAQPIDDVIVHGRQHGASDGQQRQQRHSCLDTHTGIMSSYIWHCWLVI